MFRQQSGLQIFKDPNECLKPSVTKSKLKTTGLKHRKSSFKDSTNTLSSRSLSETSNNDVKKSFVPEKFLKKHASLSNEPQSKSWVKESTKYDSADEYSDIEYMGFGDIEEDDYEDIVPKCERIQQQDIDSFFQYSPVPMISEITVDLLPVAELDEVCDFDLQVPFPIFRDLPEAEPCLPVELPDFDFNF